MTTATIDLSTLFQKMPIPRLVFEVRASGGYYVACANDMAARYLGRPAGEIAGRELADLMDHDNTHHFQQSFEVCCEKKQSVTIQTLPGMPGGNRVYGFYISPLMDEAGAVQYLDVIAQIDVADQSILQRERDDAISLLTSIFDVSEIGIIVTDQAGRIVRVNDAFVRVYGWARDELVGTDAVELATPDERARARENHDIFIQTGQRSSGEMKLIRKNSSIANVLFTTATLELSQKRRFQVTTLMDITQRKQMEESLRLAKDQADAANRAKSTFLANMSHELRTPLNAIIGFSEMMINQTFGALGNPKYAEYMGDVHSSACHLLEIINEVLDMSKIEAGRIELDEHEVDMADMVQAVARMMASRAFGSDLHIKTDIAEGLPNLYADQRLLRQIMINIVANAVKFSRPGGEILIKAHTVEDGRMQIVISDQGIGIPKDKIRQAMEPFGQVSDYAENAKHHGTGLGLPLAKAMVDLHGGSLRLESDMGQGTQVFIAFPLYRNIARKANVFGIMG